MESVKNPIFGDQSENVAKTGYLHFMIRQPDFQIKKSFDRGIQVFIQRVKLEMSKPYSNIDDILSDVKLIPLDHKNVGSNIRVLSRLIMEDGLVPPPTVYDEYSVIAYTGNNSFDRPIALVEENGKKTYYAHPEISRLVRRIDVQAAEGVVPSPDVQ